MSGPLNYTTEIPVSRTAGECQQILANAGASTVSVTYSDRKPTGLAFRLTLPTGPRDFQMPVNVAGVHKVLNEAYNTGKLRASRGRSPLQFTSYDHAARVAWRVVKDWLEAQLALIDAEMVTLDQVMLPYLQVEGGLTLYDAFLANEQRAIGAGR